MNSHASLLDLAVENSMELAMEEGDPQPIGLSGTEVTVPTAYAVVRLVVDFLLALLVLLLVSPVLVAIAVVIKLDSPGPVFFRQLRVGKRGKPFAIVKFRTMYAGSPTYSDKVTETDPSITRFGGVLRRTGLDELPQLLNVLRGEMALIGPRPEQVPLLGNYRPWQLDRHLVRPGITGWWQVHHRDSIPMYENVEKDLYYIRNMGPKLDLIIVGKTFSVVIGGLRLRSSATGPLGERRTASRNSDASPAIVEDLGASEGALP